MKLIVAKLRNKLKNQNFKSPSNPVMTATHFKCAKQTLSFLKNVQIQKSCGTEICSTRGIQPLHLGCQTNSFQKDPCDLSRETLSPQWPTTKL